MRRTAPGLTCPYLSAPRRHPQEARRSPHSYLRLLLRGQQGVEREHVEGQRRIWLCTCTESRAGWYSPPPTGAHLRLPRVPLPVAPATRRRPPHPTPPRPAQCGLSLRGSRRLFRPHNPPPRGGTPTPLESLLGRIWPRALPPAGCHRGSHKAVGPSPYRGPWDRAAPPSQP